MLGPLWATDIHTPRLTLKLQKEVGWVGSWRGNAGAFRFQPPPVEPCMRFSRTRLTDALHRRCSTGARQARLGLGAATIPLRETSPPVARGTAMSALAQNARDYLALRRSLGHKLAEAARLLRRVCAPDCGATRGSRGHSAPRRSSQCPGPRAGWSPSMESSPHPGPTGPGGLRSNTAGEGRR